MTEKGVNADLWTKYKLKQDPTSGSAGAEYIARTEANVKEADLTVVFNYSPKTSRGSKRTVELAHKHGKSVLENPTADEIVTAVERLERELGRNVIINGAGNRGSHLNAGHERQVREILRQVNGRLSG